ncbi:hypothetical protein TH25_17145 [Thalassospira profundimaris]|uniref:Uncharacterized protein n=1 Tax=Thalassospira profundimaris TaxID=502049 RepID=A0A367WWZ5_9PROT|nr:hypothetical protein TH25_17145 [Thalassospira profundimaris]
MGVSLAIDRETGWCRHRDPCDGSEAGEEVIWLAADSREITPQPFLPSNGRAATPLPSQGLTKMGWKIGGGWKRQGKVIAAFALTALARREPAFRHTLNRPAAEDQTVPPSSRAIRNPAYY